MKATITGIGCVAPQETLGETTFLAHPVFPKKAWFEVINPDYKSYIPVKSLRRMSKIVRMGVVAAKTALDDAQLEQPDAIVTGTGMGSQKETETFLIKMINNHETLLNPTAFMQSTHNTVGAQIALGLKNKNTNFTFVHRTFSLEHSLLEAMMLLEEKEAENVLVGGVDEITHASRFVKTLNDYYKKKPLTTGLLEDQQKGAFPGEGAGFFVLSRRPGKSNYGTLSGVKTFFRPASFTETETEIKQWLAKQEISIDQIDLVLLGFNGDPDFDTVYQKLEEGIFSDTNTGYFKHLCGEFDTSSAFALWIAANCIKRQEIPAVCRKRERKPVSEMNTILIYNQFRNINHSLILLQR